jgi:hypothetical protein
MLMNNKTLKTINKRECKVDTDITLARDKVLLIPEDLWATTTSKACNRT